MLLVERRIISEEKQHFLGSPEQEKRINAGLDAVNAIEGFVDHVRSPENYRNKAEGYKLPSEKIGDLPYDSARKGFKHMDKHLKTFQSMPMRDTLRGILNNRRINNKEMEKMYISLQKETLGVESTKSKGQDKGIER